MVKRSGYILLRVVGSGIFLLWGQKKSPCYHGDFKLMLASAYFPTHKYAVSSAMRCLTTGFGMGPGVPTSLWTPANSGFYWEKTSSSFPQKAGIGFCISIEGLERELVQEKVERPISTGKLNTSL